MMFQHICFRRSGYTAGVSDTPKHPAAGVTTVKLPYTSHSTPLLLRQCVAALQPRRIIPTAHVTADKARHALKPCLACATMSIASLCARVKYYRAPCKSHARLCMHHQCHPPRHAIFTHLQLTSSDIYCSVDGQVAKLEDLTRLVGDKSTITSFFKAKPTAGNT
jgi:hypothetical protein